MNSPKTAHLILLATLILTVLGTIPSRANALTVENVTFAENIQAGTVNLALHNAALLRYLKLIKAYVAALYLPEGGGAGQSPL